MKHKILNLDKTKLENENLDEPQNPQLNIPAVSGSKNFRVTVSLCNHNWNGGQFKQKREIILAKNKTSAIAKFIKLHRTYMNKFDIVDIECKLDVL